MPTEPDRRWRRDRLSDRIDEPRGSGRRVVVIFVVAVLGIWLGLDLTFRSWKARYQARADFGASRVAPTVDPFTSLDPPGLDPIRWKTAVADTHAMLVALTGAGVLDESQMDGLRKDLAARVVKARPETALATLGQIWDDLERQAGPLIAPDLTPPPPRSRHAARHPRPSRPSILGPSHMPPRSRGI